MRPHPLAFNLFGALCFVALALPAGVLAQTSYLRPFTDQSATPSGPTLNSVSTYTGVYALGSPTNVMGQATSASSAGTMLVGGVSTDTGWYLNGRQSQVFVDYTLAYNGNAQFPQLGGFDHVLVFGAQTKLSARWTLVLDGLGESISYGGILFEPSSGLLLAEQGDTVERLGGAPANAVLGTGPASSPLGLSIYGARRRDAAVGATLVFSRSPRTTWTVSTRFLRFLPATAEGAGVSESIAYSGLTQGIVIVGFTHSLSRRTEVDWELSESRSYWMGRGVEVGSSQIGLGHDLSPRWFTRISAGYGGMTEFPASLKQPYQGAAEGGASLGAKLGLSTLVLSANRSVSDAYGLGASNSTGAQFAWTWQRPGGAWTVESSVAYERLSGTVFALVQGWMGQLTASRRISRQLMLVAQGVYATDAGPAGGDFASLMRRGARLSLTWRPGPAPAK